MPKTFAGALLGLKGAVLVGRTPVADQLFRAPQFRDVKYLKNRTVSALSSKEVGCPPAGKPQNAPVMSTFNTFVGRDSA